MQEAGRAYLIGHQKNFGFWFVQVPDAWRGLVDAPEAIAGDSRVIYSGRGAQALQAIHCGNSIHTAKYNVITFFPIFLFTMFSRVAYLYFLSQCALAYWSTISPFSPYVPAFAASGFGHVTLWDAASLT